ncbi:MAG: transport system ATP-binding/permease protein, partial [Microbacteriaceae bacterium]|nr:transport system ATP-binding/permease protein [Microbacteriaceae bacterium]
MTTTNLIVRFGDESFELEPGKRFQVGRGADVELTVHEPDVSRHHAAFYFTDGWWVADEGSVNGTFVDGRRISAPTEIRAASIVQLGGLDTRAILHVEPLAVPVSAGAGGEVGGTVLKGPRPQPFRDEPGPAPLPSGVVAITLGKAPDNDIVIDDINVSRHHARVVPGGDGFLVEDLNSLNGTLLNAVPVQRGFMTDADTLTLGNTDFVRRDGRLIRASEVATGDRGLRVAGLEFTLAGGKRLIDGVALRAGRGSLTAIIGPSGAGKSTLAGLLAGVSAPTAGNVEFDGFDLQRDYQAVKTRVGLVPQDDVVHRQLLLRTALRYAADLRLPSKLPASAKDEQVDKTIAQLGLTQHADTRIERLSGGQRKRASVALELLTEPSLLILDEPTSGLDPALDRQVMRTLRELADGERTVIVITHSVAYLDICDQVLVLAPGGLPAYLGRADG